MRIGKVDPEILTGYVFPYLGAQDPDLLIGPVLGEDAAVVRDGDRYLVVACDPITGTEVGIGRYVVDINANDVATMGAEPRYMTITLILPPDRQVYDLERITREIDDAAKRLGIAIIGGHTEVTDRVDKPILVGCALGFTPKPLAGEDVNEGDVILLTKGAGIEGTSILAQLYADELRRVGVTEGTITVAREFSKRLSVVPEALIAREFCSFMHDPTEGGVLGGLIEISKRTGKGFSIEQGIQVDPVTEQICEVLSVDPIKLIGSGALLIVTPADHAETLLNRLHQTDIPAEAIGVITGEPSEQEIPQDELWRLIEERT
ncbi:MAG: AIR synthase family protein [Candidatus Bipolaricaulia bacterium]